VKKLTLPHAIIFIVASCFPAAESVADIYRWVDKNNGGIFFSETPPPPEISTDYENITATLKKGVMIKRPDAKKSTVVTDTARVNSNQSAIPDVSPGSEKTAVISDRDLLIQRRCQIFNQQIDNLEQLISKAIDPDEMDRFFLKLVEYEKSYTKNCK